MGKIISTNSQKGGCGKTTTVQSLAAGLTMRGNQCLVIDLDPQGNLSAASGVEDYDHTIYELMKRECSFDEACKVNEYYDILSADLTLSDFNQEFTGEGKEYVLRNVLEQIRDRYDYIIIDTPSSHGILNINSLVASDYVLLPTEQSFYAMHGLEQLHDVIRDVQLNYNPDLKVLGLLIVKYNEKTSIDRFLKGLIDRFVNEYGINLFDTFIHESSKVNFAQGMLKNIIEFSPKNQASKDYKKLADIVDQEFRVKAKRHIV